MSSTAKARPKSVEEKSGEMIEDLNWNEEEWTEQELLLVLEILQEEIKRIGSSADKRRLRRLNEKMSEIKTKLEDVRSSNGWSFFKSVAIVAGAGIASVVAFPVVLGAVGFTSAGITAGSYAASAMSAAAVANGGAIAAGSTVAVLQSVGAAGLGIGGQIAVGSTGAGLAAGVMKVFERK